MSEAHVVPNGDLVEHDLHDGCACGPTPTFVDGGVVMTHHSLDGRELDESATDLLDQPLYALIQAASEVLVPFAWELREQGWHVDVIAEKADDGRVSVRIEVQVRPATPKSGDREESG
jgi:hypothetical protein